MQAAKSQESALRKELGLRDLVLAQVLCVVGSTWVGVAAKLGRSEAVFWLGAMALFYLPLAAVVIYLNRLMPLEGGFYQWAKQGFGEMAGFLTAWNLWVYAIVSTASIVFVIPTDLYYMLGPSAAWIPASKLATLALTGAVMVAIALVAIHGLDIGKWLHNIGSILILAGLRDPLGPAHLGAAPRAHHPLRARPMADAKARLVRHRHLRTDDAWARSAASSTWRSWLEKPAARRAPSGNRW